MNTDESVGKTSFLDKVGFYAMTSCIDHSDNIKLDIALKRLSI